MVFGERQRKENLLQDLRVDERGIEIAVVRLVAARVSRRDHREADGVYGLNLRPALCPRPMFAHVTAKDQNRLDLSEAMQLRHHFFTQRTRDEQTEFFCAMIGEKVETLRLVAEHVNRTDRLSQLSQVPMHLFGQRRLKRLVQPNQLQIRVRTSLHRVSPVGMTESQFCIV